MQAEPVSSGTGGLPRISKERDDSLPASSTALTSTDTRRGSPMSIDAPPCVLSRREAVPSDSVRHFERFGP
jgi:hypothetical protein